MNRCVRSIALVLFCTSPAVQAADGASIYGGFCKSCHGENAVGLREYAGSPEQFRATLEGEANPTMPDFYGVFDDDEIAELYGYVMMHIGGSEPTE